MMDDSIITVIHLGACMSGGAVRDEKNNIISIESSGFHSDVDKSEKFNKALAMSESVVADIKKLIKKSFP